MAKEPKAPKENKEDGLFEEAPKPPKAVIKVVAINVDEEYTEPEGWLLKEIHSVDVETGKFFGVLVKIHEDPNARTKSRISKPVNLKD